MKRLLKVSMILAAVFFGLVLIAFLFKSTLFRWVLDRQIRDLSGRTGLHISYDQSALEGISDVDISGLSAVDVTGDSLLYLGHLHSRVNLFALMGGKHLLRSLTLEDAVIRYRKKEHITDTGQVTPQPDAKTKNEPDMSKMLNKLRKLLPSEVSLYRCAILYRDTLGEASLYLDSLLSDGPQLSGVFRLADPVNEQGWRMEGSMEKGISIRTWPLEHGPLPVVRTRLGADVRCDTLGFSIHKSEGKQNDFELSGELRKFRIYHASLSSDTLGMDTLDATLRVSLDAAYLEVDTNSTFRIDAIKGRAGFRFPLHHSLKQYSLIIHTDEIPASAFFASLPEGAFDDTRGIKADGTLSYHLRFALDGEYPDDVVFESGLNKTNFRIRGWGATDLGLMSDSFMYTVYEQDKAVRRFRVGPQNPEFTPFERVPANLVNAILVSEDPSFFRHRGFIPEAFRESIAENYKSKSFKRGGSTISMQLVKNVFLSRKKTVFRKVEEALIVWLIEGQGLTSKERMMEVYLNIIEWGPDVYGVREAARFYFSREPEDLTLSECIYLANIIPRPKKFRYAFDQEGNLRPYMDELHRFILKRMVARELLPPADTLNYRIDLRLQGPARNLVVPLDSADEDSIEILAPILPAEIFK